MRSVTYLLLGFVAHAEPAEWNDKFINKLVNRAMEMRLLPYATVCNLDGTTLAKPCRGFIHGSHSPLLAPCSKFQLGSNKFPAVGLQIRSLGSQFLVPAFHPFFPSFKNPNSRLPFSATLCFLSPVPRFLPLAPHSIPEDGPEQPSNKEFWQQAFQALVNNEERLLATMATEGYEELGRGAIWVQYGEDYQMMSGDGTQPPGFENLAAIDAVQRNDFSQRTINLGEGAILKLRYLPFKTWYASDMGGVTDSITKQIEAYNPQQSFIVVLQAFDITGGSKRQLPAEFTETPLVYRRGVQ